MFLRRENLINSNFYVIRKTISIISFSFSFRIIKNTCLHSFNLTAENISSEVIINIVSEVIMQYYSEETQEFFKYYL